MRILLFFVTFLFATPDVMLLKVYKDQNVTGKNNTIPQNTLYAFASIFTN